MQISCLLQRLQHLCGSTMSCACVCLVACIWAFVCAQSAHVFPCMSVCVIPVMGIITTEAPWLRVTAGLVCCPSKWISMGKQTQDAVSNHTDTLKLFRQGVLSSTADLGAIASMIQSQHLFGPLERFALTQQTGSRELWMDRFWESWGDKWERGERESRLTQQTVRGARLAAVCFFLLILKSSIIRMRGREHVAWLRTAESMLGPGRIASWWGNLTGQ